MKNWYLNLAARERLIVGVGGVLALIIVIWGMIWKPLHDRTIDLRESITDKSLLVNDLRRAASLATSGALASGGGAEQSLVILVDNTARPSGLAATFSRTRPDGPNAINISFESAPFDTLLTWLIGLEETYGISVQSASVNEARAPGLVNGQILLSRI